MNHFCSRHQDALLMAVALHGLAADLVFDPVAFAAQTIVNHATHFAGQAAVEMLERHYCPLCFVNRALRQTRHDGATVDDWVDHAADEALDEDIRRRDAPGSPERHVQ